MVLNRLAPVERERFEAQGSHTGGRPCRPIYRRSLALGCNRGHDTQLVEACGALHIAQAFGQGRNAVQDTERIERFFELTGNTWLLKLRNNARAAWRALELVPEVLPGEIGKHIYGSMYRPMDSMWAHIPGAQFVQTGRANLSEAMPHTWVVTKEPLPKSTIDRFELSWGWSPIHE